jgi:hypothetical protein
MDPNNTTAKEHSYTIVSSFLHGTSTCIPVRRYFLYEKYMKKLLRAGATHMTILYKQDLLEEESHEKNFMGGGRGHSALTLSRWVLVEKRGEGRLHSAIPPFPLKVDGNEKLGGSKQRQ